MTRLQVFDRPLCCSTGICGPSVDPALVHFAADLDWVKGHGVEVHRYNLAFDPAEFTRHDDVKAVLAAEQLACLPLVRLDGQIVSKGAYPGREQLAAWCGIREPNPVPADAATRPAATGCC